MTTLTTEMSARNKFRRKLSGWGMPEADVAQCVIQMVERRRLKTEGKLDADAPLCTLDVYVEYLRMQPDSQGAPVLQDER